MFAKAIILGNVIDDIEVRKTQTGKKVANFRVAANHKFGDTEEVFYANVVVWEKVAELCQRYLQKGNKVLIEGRLVTRTWDNADGRQSRTEIVAEKVVFLQKDRREVPDEYTEKVPF